MMARAHQRGCKADSALVLSGRQYAGKSTVLRILATDEFFTDAPISMASPKDSVPVISGVWIIELGELASMSRSKIETVKQFLSSQVDRLRKSYGRRVVDVPRRCVFAGTTNADSFLRDSTGSRRFWPVFTADEIDLDWLRENRDQLMAEARVAYQAGEQWHLTREENEQRHRDSEHFQVQDSWEPQIAAWVTANPGKLFTTFEAIKEGLGTNAPGTVSKSHEMRVRHILEQMSLQKRRMTPPGRPRAYYWTAPGQVQDTGNVVPLQRDGADEPKDTEEVEDLMEEISKADEWV